MREREKERGRKEGEAGEEGEGAEAGQEADLEAGGFWAGISEEWAEMCKAEERAREGGAQGQGVQGPAAARAGATLAGLWRSPAVSLASAAHHPRSPAGR